MSNRNAYIGRNVEILFKNSISDHPTAISKIQSYFNIGARYLGAISTGIHAEKADVKMEFADGHNIDANVKAFKKSGMSYNQLTRTPISNFCKRFSIESEQKELESLFIEKARNVKGKLFPENIQSRIRNIYEKISEELLKWSFSYKESREIIVIYERDESIMYIYPMKDVFRKFDYSITFTIKGNMAIGNCVIFQRKGGNGKQWENVPKDSLRHPGNNVQLKLKMKEFVRDMESVLLAKYQI